MATKQTIKITEQRLRELIKETVSDALNRLEILNEMAVPLKSYKARVDGLRFQMVENWCLCKFCQLYSNDNPNFKHWIGELKACINNIKFLDIKGGIDKRKTLKNMLIRDYDYNQADMIIRIISDKFQQEGIKEMNKITQVGINFADGIEDLINVISINSLSTDAYIQKQFG